MNTSQVSTSKSSKSAVMAFMLCLFLGTWGLHRFYVRKIGTGILMLITGGGLGIWALIDLIFIVNNKFEDNKGNLLVLTQNPSRSKKATMLTASIIGFLVIFVLMTFILIPYAAFHLAIALSSV